MFFTVTRYEDEPVLNDLTGEVVIPGIEFWNWQLVKSDGHAVCRNATSFASEKEARSDIASAKKSMKGASRCKVVTVDG